MRYALVLATLLWSLSDPALAGSVRVITGNNGPTTVSGFNTVVNQGTITGGKATGLTVTGAQQVINSGTITETTGLSVSGSSTSSVINMGTIAGFSSNVAVGISQVP